MLRSHRLFESFMPTKTLLKRMERSETLSKSCKQMRRKRFTVRKFKLKKSTDFFLIFLSMRKYSIYANGFVYFRESSLDETRRILLAKIATSRLPFGNTRVTVYYSNLPHCQDYLTPRIEHATPHATFIAK